VMSDLCLRGQFRCNTHIVCRIYRMSGSRGSAVEPLPGPGTSAPGARTASVDGLLSPPAVRRHRARWRDPRLWGGAVLLAVSALGGARLLARGDDSVLVWTAAHDLTTGQTLHAGDLVESRVGFASGDERSRYLAVAGTPPAGLTILRDVTAGELVARTMVSPDARPRPQLPLAVDEGDAPGDLRAGDRVAVWAVPDAQSPHAGGPSTAALVLADVEVLGVDDASGLSGARQVLVGVNDQQDVRSALDGLVGARIVIVRVGA
jgi:hypothetical protein